MDCSERVNQGEFVKKLIFMNFIKDLKKEKLFDVGQ